MLGVSGNCGERSAPVTASAFTLPALTCGMVGGPSGNGEQRIALDDAQDHLVRALVRDHDAGNARFQLEQFGRDDEGRRRRRIIRLVGMLLSPFDQILDVLDRAVAGDDQDQRKIRDHRQRLERLDRIVFEVRIDRAGDRHHAARRRPSACSRRAFVATHIRRRGVRRPRAGSRPRPAGRAALTPCRQPGARKCRCRRRRRNRRSAGSAGWENRLSARAGKTLSTAGAARSDIAARRVKRPELIPFLPHSLATLLPCPQRCGRVCRGDGCRAATWWHRRPRFSR